MRLFVDADACPRAVKEILGRAVARVQVPMIMVSNLNLQDRALPHVSHVNVPGGPDMADDKIVEMVAPGDLVITADIPLADRVVSLGAYALDPRGDLYTPATVKQRLAVRNLLDHLRSTGLNTGGPAPFTAQDRRAFANQLDRFLNQHR
jgi:uncharacterized protein YaiI (UPF0178 family)